MSKQLKNRLTEQETIELLERYLAGEIGVNEAMRFLGLKRRRFFSVLKEYRQAGSALCLRHKRTTPTRQIPLDTMRIRYWKS